MMEEKEEIQKNTRDTKKIMYVTVCDVHTGFSVQRRYISWIGENVAGFGFSPGSGLAKWFAICVTLYDT